MPDGPDGVRVASMTAAAILAGTCAILAGYFLAAWRASERRISELHLEHAKYVVEIGGRYDTQLRETQALVAKLVSRESKPEVVVRTLGEQIGKIQADFNESLTKILIGYNNVGGGRVVEPPPDIEYGRLDNSFNVGDTRQWLPQHELTDSNMWPDGLPPLKETPDGPGGWVE